MESTSGRIVITSAIVISMALHAGWAGAQAYPNRPVRLIMPVAPGGPSDTAGRVMSQTLSTVLGQTIVVDNRPGAGGLIGGTLVSKSHADGYTLGLASTSHRSERGPRRTSRQKSSTARQASKSFTSLSRPSPTYTRKYWRARCIIWYS